MTNEINRAYIHMVEEQVIKTIDTLKEFNRNLASGNPKLNCYNSIGTLGLNVTTLVSRASITKEIILQTVTRMKDEYVE